MSNNAANNLQDNTSTKVVGQQGAEGSEENTPLIFIKSHEVGLDSKDRQKVVLRLSESETNQIKEQLANIKERVKLQIHIGPTSAFMFIKEVMPKSEMMTKKKELVSAATKAKLDAFKQSSTTKG